MVPSELEVRLSGKTPVPGMEISAGGGGGPGGAAAVSASGLLALEQPASSKPAPSSEIPSTWFMVLIIVVTLRIQRSVHPQCFKVDAVWRRHWFLNIYLLNSSFLR